MRVCDVEIFADELAAIRVMRVELQDALDLRMAGIFAILFRACYAQFRQRLQFIPLIAAVLMIVHFWRVRKDGGISGPL